MGAYALLYSETTKDGVALEAHLNLVLCKPEIANQYPPELWKDGVRSDVVEQPNAAVKASAQAGAASAYQVLQCRKGIRSGDRFIAAYRFEGCEQVRDASGGLLYALLCAQSLATDQVGRRVDFAYAATGELKQRGDSWEVCPVSCLNQKLKAALHTMEAGSRIFYPRAHDVQQEPAVEPIDPDLEVAVLERTLVLCPVSTVEEAIALLLGLGDVPPPVPLLWLRLAMVMLVGAVTLGLGGDAGLTAPLPSLAQNPGPVRQNEPPAVERPQILAPPDGAELPRPGQDPACPQTRLCKEYEIRGRVPPGYWPFLAVAPVRDPTIYIQPPVRQVRGDGTFTGWVYLGTGDNAGQGIGEKFTIFVLAHQDPQRFPGKTELQGFPPDCLKSDPVTVLRTK